MGRHRRSADGRATTGRAAQATPTRRSGPDSADPPHSYEAGRAPRGIAPYLNPEAYTETNARSTAYLFAGDGEPSPASPGGSGSTPVGGGGSTPGGGPLPEDGPSGGHRRRKKAARPVRTGLLGVSAAVALGTVAVTTGVVPGLEHYRLGGGTTTTGGDRVQAVASPGNTAAEQGGTSGSADAPGGSASGASSTGSAHRRPASPTPSASPSRSASPSPARTKAPSRKPAAPPTATPSRPAAAPSHAATSAPARTSAPVTVSAQAAAEAEVIRLVNEERAKVGCSALAANSSLTGLAEAFSADMAARGFFDHTDPDGATPWDRAAKAGVTDLGGENIARGQADAAAVMEAWMNSAGHRANILNCDFRTLGVGVHYGAGGPWWTQDFGY
ncbi:CAP domain-containing protein [Streptomyces sp. TG1A-8]|uniref:CAP domain-containing protein n=1 Tax=Streptomyces sp. TG1A-8 TaxID=3051385 RepID=UPI00265C1AD2|nr:CAP domain-containing protein [Streptomyces sp. TG1A-8]MDO0925537.1 CAP domain-containing protein [Streptomyces sp. TG1A-8]